MNTTEEYAFISCLLNKPELIDRVSSKIKPEYFEDDCCRLIYSKMLELASFNTPLLAKELKDDFRQEYPEVRVRGLVGMRNMFAHQYHNMDIDEIWSTATIDIPLIASVIKKILVDNNIFRILSN